MQCKANLKPVNKKKGNIRAISIKRCQGRTPKQVPRNGQQRAVCGWSFTLPGCSIPRRIYEQIQNMHQRCILINISFCCLKFFSSFLRITLLFKKAWTRNNSCLKWGSRSKKFLPLSRLTVSRYVSQTVELLATNSQGHASFVYLKKHFIQLWVWLMLLHTCKEKQLGQSKLMGAGQICVW